MHGVRCWGTRELGVNNLENLASLRRHGALVAVNCFFRLDWMGTYGYFHRMGHTEAVVRPPIRGKIRQTTLQSGNCAVACDMPSPHAFGNCSASVDSHYDLSIICAVGDFEYLNSVR